MSRRVFVVDDSAFVRRALTGPARGSDLPRRLGLLP